MENKIHFCIIKGGYVTNVIVGAESPHPEAPEGHSIVPDPLRCVAIGDWYEEAEGVFYRPLSDPPDRA